MGHDSTRRTPVWGKRFLLRGIDASGFARAIYAPSVLLFSFIFCARMVLAMRGFQLIDGDPRINLRGL